MELNANGNKRGMNSNSRKNLEKGRQGNNFAGKDYSITRVVREMIDNKAEERFLDVPDKGKGLTWREAIALRMLRDGVCGKYNELLERLEGKVTQPVEAAITGNVNFVIGRGYTEDGSDKH